MSNELGGNVKISVQGTRAVLAGRMTRARAARTLDVKESAFLGAVILHGAGETSGFDRQAGGLNQLLCDLVVAPGIPEGEWPELTAEGYPRYPDWYNQKVEYRLLDTLRRYRLTESQGRSGHGLRLVERRAITSLLNEDPAYRERAQIWYGKVRQAQLERKKRASRHRRRLPEAQQALGRVLRNSGYILRYPDALEEPEQITDLVDDLRGIAAIFDREE